MLRPRALVSLLALVVAVVVACGDDEPARPAAPQACVPPPPPAVGVVLEPALGDVRFTQPVEIVLGPPAASGAARFYVLEQAGRVKIAALEGGEPSLALDITSRIKAGGEAGLLGLAFDPKFSDNGFVYLYFTALLEEKPGIVWQDVLARYTSKDGGATLDPASEKILLSVDDPFGNHNGGKLAFGPDGYLYVSLGDGGSGGDPRGNAQNMDALLGKILRVDPASGDPYGIPADNPFARGGGRPEIWAYGLRNPWKLSFDRETGDLWCADVGQNRYEEVNRIIPGGNYGWPIREGKHCYEAATCATEGLVDPVAEYRRTEGISVTGGYVYRGKRIAALTGKFVYGDFGTGNIWGVDARGQEAGTLLTSSSLKISTFAQDADGEVYVADYATGAVKQLAAAPGAPLTAGEGTSLVSTGCIDPVTKQAPPGAIPYTVSSPVWSDGAEEDRWLFVPKDGKLTVGPDGDFGLPPSSVVLKSFSVGGKLVETRLLVRYADGGWAGYSYEWSDDGADATLLADGKTKDLGGGSSWTFPSRSECFACHTSAAGFSLGLEARQLNHDGVIERFAPVLASPVDAKAFAPLAAADSATASAEARARGYLHANCSMCHRAGNGTGAAQIDLRADRSLVETRTCGVAPQAGDLGRPGARIVTPGDPGASTLAMRLRRTGDGQMPPLARGVVDEAGAGAIEAWIRELSACP